MGKVEVGGRSRISIWVTADGNCPGLSLAIPDRPHADLAEDIGIFTGDRLATAA